MRLPSLHHLGSETRRSVARFPFVILAALVAAASGALSVGGGFKETFVKVMVAAQPGIPLFFAIAVAGEARRWPRGLRLALSLAGALLLVGYFFTLPDWMRPGAVTRFLQFAVALHLLVAFAPFVRPGRANGFWQYNKALFLRFLTAALYSVVVYAGLSVALLAVDKLLGLKVDGDWYLRLWMAIALAFNTAVFLGGVPEDIPGLDAVADYPRALKVFAQYILIPLVVVYLAILTTYLFKVVITTQWPSGWIGYLVSSVAVVGILALLLVWPVSERTENRWVATYTRGFFIFMVPAIVMLLLAIYKRIDQYGITENRYFLAVLALWLAAIAVYFIASPQKSIKPIPMSLCVIALATSFGPWGAYTVARRSQTARLEVLLERNGILADGVLARAGDDVPFEDRREISAVTRYLVEYHGVDAFEPWLGREQRAAAADTLDEYERRNASNGARMVMAEMGIEYVDQWARAGEREGYFNYTADAREDVFPVDGADYFVRLSKHSTPMVPDDRYTLTWDDTLGVVLRDSGAPLVTLRFEDLFDHIETAHTISTDPNRLPRDVMHLHGAVDRAALDVYFLTISGSIKDGVRRVNYFEANCFVTAE